MTDETKDPTTPRGEDDRRKPVDPNTNPPPSSPEPDHEAVRKGEETLKRV
jgi:hypothetical protein